MTIIQVTSPGDGSADDTANFVNTINANPGKAIFVPDPPVNYVLSQTITMPPNTRLYGQGKFTTKLFKSGNADMFVFGDGASLSDLWIDGQGATNTGGRGALIGAINTTDGHQNLTNVRLINFPADCVAFVDVNSGSQFTAINCEFNQYGASTGSGRFAVSVADAPQLSAVPRKFIGCEFQGAPSFDFGGSNDFFISGCFLGDLRYSANSRGIQIGQSRIANQTNLLIYGHNHTIVGCDVNPQITLTSGVDNCHIGPNSLNNAPVIDKSGNGRNQIFGWSASYTPTLCSTGVAASIGNGSIAGRWVRSGAIVHVSIQFAPGSTTSFGTGQIGFSLPAQAANNSDVSQLGTVLINHGELFTGLATLSANSQVAYLARDTSGAITGTSPIAWAPGDIFNVSMSYSVGV